ncbi:transposase zinc-binding domain-containing protein [Lucifera butyrica]|nr:transposase zinc-binding domain-containing protein [Lucifera butyrica]
MYLIERNILRRIFFDDRNNWEKFKAKYGSRIREVVVKEVEKFRNCGDPRNGFKLFVCEGCHEIRRVPFRCKSRFCTTCSCGETEEWSRIMAEEVVQVNHRHLVLTIDEGLREIFERNRFLLKEFMDEAVRIVQEYFKKKYKVPLELLLVCIHLVRG